jgi:quinol monooxygenase YgiN
MIFIVVRWPVKAEHAEQWPQLVAEFTQGTRSEPGNLWFDWSRSLEDPNEYVLVEAFRDQQAAVAHVTSSHFAQATSTLGRYLAERPLIINVPDVPGEEWNRLAEVTMPGD